MSEGEKKETSRSLSFQGSCFCGDASFRVEGEPLISVYCHCTVCQRFNGTYTTIPHAIILEPQLPRHAPIGCVYVHGLHYPASSFSWAHQKPEAIFTKSTKESKWKVWRCQRCLTFIAAHNPSRGKWSVKSSHFERNAKGLIENWERVKPRAHIFYGTRMLDVQDDLPKWEGYEYKSGRMDLEGDRTKSAQPN